MSVWQKNLDPSVYFTEDEVAISQIQSKHNKALKSMKTSFMENECL